MAGKTEQTRHKIMRAAYEIAADKGLKGVTVRGIAAKAQTSVGLVYYHFKDVPQIFEMILQHHYEQILNYLDEHLPASDDPLLRFMAVITINIQFTSSRKVFRNISRGVPFSGITRDSYYFSVIKQGIESIQQKMALKSDGVMLDTAVFAFIGSLETIKSACFRSQLLLTPYELAKIVFLQTFTPMGLDVNEIASRVPEIEKICRNCKREDIAVPLLASAHDDAPDFNQVSLHELGQRLLQKQC